MQNNKLTLSVFAVTPLIFFQARITVRRRVLSDLKCLIFDSMGVSLWLQEQAQVFIVQENIFHVVDRIRVFTILCFLQGNIIKNSTEIIHFLWRLYRSKSGILF